MYKVLNIILVSFLLLSCNKATIDLSGFELMEGGVGSNNSHNLVGKWVLEKMEGGPIEMIDEDLSDGEGVFVEFLPNGKVHWIIAYLDDDGKLTSDTDIDTYTVSADGKTVTVVNEDDGPSVLKIINLTSISLVLKEDIDGEIITSYYSKVK